AFAFPVLLVVVFGRIPLGRTLDRGDCLLSFMFGIPAGDGRFGLGALRVAQREDGAAVLRADIVALPVELGGIMSAKEDIEHFGIRDHAGIVGHADRLGMASRAAAHLLVGGVR